MAPDDGSCGSLSRPDRQVPPRAVERAAIPRTQVLRRAAIAVGALVAGDAAFGRLTALGAASPSPAQDVQILKFGLLLEELQAAFYAGALAHASLGGELRDFAEVVASHERQHAAFIRKVLGAKAGRTPRFDFGDAVRTPKRFAATAVALEDLGVAAYNAQAPNLTPGALAAAGRIVSVEARHAAWIRDDRQEPCAARSRLAEGCGCRDRGTQPNALREIEVTRRS